MSSSSPPPPSADFFDFSSLPPRDRKCLKELRNSRRSRINREEKQGEKKRKEEDSSKEGLNESSILPFLPPPDFPSFPPSSLVAFEYLDHTADIQIHSWGISWPRAFESAAFAMENYMLNTDLSTIPSEFSLSFEISSSSRESLLVRFLEEILYYFHVKLFVYNRILFHRFDMIDEFSIHAELIGEYYSQEKYGRGTEIKAITFSAIQMVWGEKILDDKLIQEEGGKLLNTKTVPEKERMAQIFVIVDI